MEGQIHGYLPTAATDMAQSWDHLYWFLTAVCVFFTILILVPMIAFAIKYRKKPGVKPVPIEHNAMIEVIWTALPTILLMGIFYWGYWLYMEKMNDAPADSLEIRVQAHSWGWTFQYPDGRTTSNLLVAPLEKPVKLVMSSKPGDVLHSFFVPNFRMKKDLVPGMFTSTWFQAKIPGRHKFFCTEYCGAGHSLMHGAVAILDDEQYQEWKWGREIELPPWVGPGGLRDLKKAKQEAGNKITPTRSEHGSLIEQGMKVASSNGCTACHSSDGMKMIGPSYRGLFGSEVTLADGSKVHADENYIRESIENPQLKVVKGFENVLMPPPPSKLSETELTALVAYIKSLE